MQCANLKEVQFATATHNESQFDETFTTRLTVDTFWQCLCLCWSLWALNRVDYFALQHEMYGNCWLAVQQRQWDKLCRRIQLATLLGTWSVATLRRQSKQSYCTVGRLHWSLSASARALITTFDSVLSFLNLFIVPDEWKTTFLSEIHHFARHWHLKSVHFPDHFAIITT